MRTRATARTLLPSLAALLALTGCMTTQSSTDNGGSTGRDPSSTDIRRGRVLASLMHASDCDELLGRIQDDVAAKIELQAEQLKRGEQDFYRGGPIGVPVDDSDNGGSLPPSAGAGTGGTGGGFPMTPSDGAGGSSAGNPNSPGEGSGAEDPVTLGPSDYSDTNTQVEGVDEADIVKTDGQRIYLIHGNELFVLKSWPANESSIESSIKLEGSVSELFVLEGKAAVFSYLYDQGDLIQPRIDADGVASYPSYYGSAFTKITLLDLAGRLPKVERELLLEGNYLSSRRHGSTVRVVLQGGFRTPPVYYANIEYRDPWGREYDQEEIDAQVDAWRDRLIAGVRMTTLDDWLPAEREVIDGVLTPPARRCTDFYAPPPGLSSYGLTNIVAFDILDPTADLGGAIVLGAADEVYSNTDALVLAQRDYRWDTRLAERERTVLHVFDVSAGTTQYTASGYAPGHIVDQFSIDERAGSVRLTTTTRVWDEWSADIAMPDENDAWQDVADDRSIDNRVVTLAIAGNELKRAGLSPSLGEVNEQIFSTRFVDDRAYVVTFRQTDPLTVVDLSEPAEPKVLGELHIPGFSDYMHPIDSDHLLAIGRDTDAQGSTLGLLLQIFDVSDPTHPELTHRHAYTSDGWSEANSNHKAFTFFRPSEGSAYEGLLAFPFVRYSGSFQSTLEVFDVSIHDGFTQLGSVDHTSLVTSCYVDRFGGVPDEGFYDPYFCGQPEVRRGLFVTDNDEDEYVYSISAGGMLVNRLPELDSPLSTVVLPAPDYSDHRNNYGGSSGPFGGTGGFGGEAGGLTGGSGGAGGAAGAGAPIAVDAGVATEPEQDAGTDVGAPDAGL